MDTIKHFIRTRFDITRGVVTQLKKIRQQSTSLGVIADMFELRLRIGLAYTPTKFQRLIRRYNEQSVSSNELNTFAEVLAERTERYTRALEELYERIEDDPKIDSPAKVYQMQRAIKRTEADIDLYKKIETDLSFIRLRPMLTSSCT